jgi:uncharacterized protein (DUF1800 family)
MVKRYSGPWNRDVITHLLKRAMFGSNKHDVDYFLTKTMDETVEELVTLQPVPAPPLKNYKDEDVGTTPDGIVYGQPWIDSPNHNPSLSNFRNASTRSWWISNMINQKKSVIEKLVLFLHNHMPSEFEVVRHSRYSLQQLQTFYYHGLRTQGFKMIIFKICTDAAMLIRLNGQYNEAGHPDENFSRELQELFTLGVGSGYEEKDIQELAKVFTGFRPNYQSNFVFVPELHDTTDKQLSAFFNNQIIQGNIDGQVEVGQAVEAIFSKSIEVSRFMVSNLYRWFVYYDITPEVQEEVINPIAEEFAKDWNFATALRLLFTSEHFYQMAGTQIKSPLDIVIGSVRELYSLFPFFSFDKQYQIADYLRKYAIKMGQALGDPPDIAGWKAYYQAPNYNRLWLSSDTYKERQKFLDKLITTGIDPDMDSQDFIYIDVIRLAYQTSNPSDPNILVKEIVDIMYAFDLTDVTLDQLKNDHLLGGLNQDDYWTRAWNRFVTDPSEANRSVVDSRIRSLVKYLLNIEQYQLQ